MKKAPIKRTEYIVPLSRDHHAGLLFCWKIKEGVRKNIPGERILAYVNFFSEQHLRPHFREEEALLFSRIDDDLCRRGKTEHRMLEERIIQLNRRGAQAQEYLSFAELLSNHIRFEERVLFPYLEATLPPATLKQVGEYLSAQHPAAYVDNYKDAFWAKTNSLEPGV